MPRAYWVVLCGECCNSVEEMVRARLDEGSAYSEDYWEEKYLTGDLD